jgi:cobalt-precorrin-6B (C15)-methyltransferase
MSRVALPHDAKAGPTKAEVRAVLLAKLDSRPTDHVAEVGSCTGAVTIEAARRAGRVTALERKRDRLETTEKNLAANQTDADVDLRLAEAPDGLPDDADALFLGGSRNYEAVLDHAVETGVDRVVMNVSRLGLPERRRPRSASAACSTRSSSSRSATATNSPARRVSTRTIRSTCW